MQPMLAHSDRGRRQLGQLTPRGLGGSDALAVGEHVRARAAPLGPMLDDLVELLGRQQPPVPTLMPGLTAPTPARTLPAGPFRRRRRILRRRQRRVPRTPTQTPLELSHASLEPLVRLHQSPVRLNHLIEPKQQPHGRLTITIQNRLGLGPLHTQTFGAPTEVPSPPERLRERPDLQAFTHGARRTRTADFLGAIPAPRPRELGLNKPFSSPPQFSPNTLPNIVQHVLAGTADRSRVRAEPLEPGS
jgi:hypothetical protein